VRRGEHGKKVYFVKQLRITEGDGEEQDARLVPMLTAEELVAELRAAFLCAEFGFDGDLRHAGYIATWIDLLRADKRGSKRRRQLPTICVASRYSTVTQRRH